MVSFAHNKKSGIQQISSHSMAMAVLRMLHTAAVTNISIYFISNFSQTELAESSSAEYTELHKKKKKSTL